MWQSNIYDKFSKKKIKVVHFVIWDQDYFVFVITSFSRLFQQQLGEICYFSYFFPSNQSTIQCNIYYPHFIGKTSQEVTIFLTQIQNYAVIHQRKKCILIDAKDFWKILVYTNIASREARDLLSWICSLILSVDKIFIF